MLYVLPIVLVVALGVSAYAAWGKVMLDTLDAVRRDDGATQQALTEAASGRAASEKTAICNAPPAERPPVCGRADEIKTRYAVAAFQLAAWERPLRREMITMEQVSDTSGQKQTEQWATATMTVLGNYIMPILYGLLGSIAYVLRRYYDRFAANLLSPRDLRSNSIRLGARHGRSAAASAWSIPVRPPRRPPAYWERPPLSRPARLPSSPATGSKRCSRGSTPSSPRCST